MNARSNIYFGQEVLPSYKELSRLDAKVSKVLHVFSEAFKQQGLLPKLVEKGKTVTDYVNFCLVGSAAEGSATARILGQVSGNETAKTVESHGFEIETDVVVYLATLNEENFAKCVEPSVGHYFKVKNCEEMWRNIQRETHVSDAVYEVLSQKDRDKVNEVMSQKDREKVYFSGKDIKDFFQTILDFDYAAMAEAFSLVDTDKSLFGAGANLTPHLEIHGPAVNVELNVKDINMCLIFDLVCIIHGDFWPPMAMKWVSRKRLWPPRHVVEEAVEQGYLLVAKPKGFGRATTDQGSADHIDETQWRMSFTLAEIVINQARSPTQKLVYLMAKTIFYTHLKLTVDGIDFSSYILKTCMMWLQEETPFAAWVEDNIVSMVSKLFQKMQDAVISGHLSYYFIPEINLLSDYPPALLDQVREKLSSIILNPTESLSAPWIVHILCTVISESLKTVKKVLEKHFHLYPVHPPFNLDFMENHTYDDYELD